MSVTTPAARHVDRLEHLLREKRRQGRALFELQHLRPYFGINVNGKRYRIINNGIPRGTKVLQPDGSEMSNVVKVE